MTAIPLFLIVLAILFATGWSAARLLLPDGDPLLRWTLSLPLAALVNVLVIFVLTVLNIPLAWWSIFPPQIIFFASSLIFSKHPSIHPPNQPMNQLTIQSFFHRSLVVLCTLLLVNIFCFSAIHAILLPSLAVDSYTNWTMRAQVSFHDRAIAFDPTEARGVAKPQYPFLVHGLQIAANQGQPVWNDRTANTVTFLLSLSTFGASFLLVRRLRGAFVALLTVTVIASMPLLSIHLAQGYGDVHLVGFLMLAFLTLVLWRESADRRWLWLSALMIAAALWTKLEGQWFGFVPWAITVLLLERNRRVLPVLLTPLLLYLPFALLIVSKGFPLTPHEYDLGFGWQPDAFPALLKAFFAFGSFGIVWYVLPVAIGTLVITKTLDRRHRILFLWGGLVLLELLVIYLFTPNAEGILNGQGFYRQALTPAALLVLACATAFKTRQSH